MSRMNRILTSVLCASTFQATHYFFPRDGILNESNESNESFCVMYVVLTTLDTHPASRAEGDPSYYYTLLFVPPPVLVVLLAHHYIQKTEEKIAVSSS